MKYSVVTACLNSSATIQKTIASVLDQSILPAEYIFVDGGSTDGTLEIIDRAIQQAKDKSMGIVFKLIHQKGRAGIYHALNMGLREVNAEIACILNSDDWYFSHTMEFVLRQFSTDVSTEIVLGDGYYFSPEKPNSTKLCRVRPFWVLPFAMAVIHPACFVRREVYDRWGLFDESFKVAADYDFIYRCSVSGVRFVNTGRVLVNVQLGGFSERHQLLASREVAAIGVRHAAYKVLPILARAMRTLKLLLRKSP
jgi:glycosyltransferase involved in cell wall biosynthesis